MDCAFYSLAREVPLVATLLGSASFSFHVMAFRSPPPRSVGPCPYVRLLSLLPGAHANTPVPTGSASTHRDLG